MSWLLQAAAHRALSQGQTPARHGVDSVETIHSFYIETQSLYYTLSLYRDTVYTIHSLYIETQSILYTVSI